MKRSIVLLVALSIVLGVVGSTIDTAQAVPAAPVTTRAEPPPVPFRVQPFYVCCRGDGYTLDIGSQVKIVYTRAVSDALYDAGVEKWCVACVLWTAVALAKVFMPVKARGCKRYPIIGDICTPFVDVRASFINDAIKKHVSSDGQVGPDGWALFWNVGMAHLYGNECLVWQATKNFGENRRFGYQLTGCRN